MNLDISRLDMVKAAVVICSTTLFLVVPGGHVVAAAGADTPRPRSAHETADRRAETARILSILGRRISGPLVRKRAAEKLVTLSDGELRLMASLADRLSIDGDGPAAGVALLLLTALLIVS
jgi:hypothetical protein